MTIYPAIDLLDGKVVRLTKGDYAQVSTYSDDPVDVAKQLEQQGAEWIHVVDLNGAKQGTSVNSEVIKSICKSVNAKVQVGGGIRTVDDAEEMLDLGITRVIIGTTALKQSNVLSDMVKQFGPESIVVSIDVKDGKPAAEGWLESTDLDSEELANQLRIAGVKTIVVTDVSKDGMLQGPNLKLVKEWISYGFEVVAAGGVTTVSDVVNLTKAGTEGAIIGKALYEGTITLSNAIKAATPSNLTRRVIACLDIKDGRVVKGTGFVDLVDSGDPLERAKSYSDTGADELVLLDIAATNEARKNRVELVKQVARLINIPFTIGGGISELDDIKRLLLAGADKVSIGSAAVTNPEFVSQAVEEFGGQAIVISIDPKREDDSWKAYIKGGSERTDVDAIDLAKDMAKRGVGELLVNSLDRDGTKQGYDIELLSAISNAVSIPVIASSGVGSLQDFAEVFDKTNVTAALGARVFHNNELGIEQVKTYLSDKGVLVRL